MTNEDLETAETFGALIGGSTNEFMQQLTAEIRRLQKDAAPLTELGAFYDDVHARNVTAGWWTDIATGLPKKRNVAEMLTLIVTELVEAFDAYTVNASDDKLPQYPGFGVELADVQIRLADLAGALRAGRVVDYSGVRNPGEEHFADIEEVAREYESIRKTPQAVGFPETGNPLPAMDVVEMIVAKLDFNAKREDHTIAHRLSEGGKRT